MAWWKYLSIILLVYALVAGILVPLKPGLQDALPESVSVGEEVEVTVYGYNTNFADQQEGLRAWLKLDDNHILPAVKTAVITDEEAKLTFNLTSPLPGRPSGTRASIILDHPTDKSMSLPAALYIKGDKEVSSDEAPVWSLSKPEGLSAKSGFYFPYRNILVETIRNIYYHVAIWFAMFLLLLLSVVRSIQYLRTKDYRYDAQSSSLVGVGILFGLLGLATGSLWAKFTWGTFWTTDVKLNMAAISLLIYLGYILLRNAIGDLERKATVSAAYAIFAYVAMIPLLFVVPRMTDSLHPGNGGNPALGGEDLDHTMRLVFYPAIIGFTLAGLWMAQLSWRLKTVVYKRLGLC
jgi:heme exporter protein C